MAVSGKKLAKRRDAIVKVWQARPLLNSENPYSISLQIDDLLPLISSKIRIVAFTACSNILGSIVPVKEVNQAIRADAKFKGAKKVKISIDCVAYAPHRQIDVQDSDIDFCVLSFYKVCPPPN
jgi:selenocysteine lyase/cysteine desulfurase